MKRPSFRVGSVRAAILGRLADRRGSRARSASAAEFSEGRSGTGWEQLFIGDGVKNCDAIPSLPQLIACVMTAAKWWKWAERASLRRNSVGSWPVADN